MKCSRYTWNKRTISPHNLLFIRNISETGETILETIDTISPQSQNISVESWMSDQITYLEQEFTSLNYYLNTRYTIVSVRWNITAAVMSKVCVFGSNQLKVKPGSLSVSISSHSLPQWLRLLRGRGYSYSRIAWHRAPPWVSSLFANSKQLQFPSQCTLQRTELTSAWKIFRFLCERWELWFVVTLLSVTGYRWRPWCWLCWCWLSVRMVFILSVPVLSIFCLCFPTPDIVRLVTVGIFHPGLLSFFPA